MRATVQKLSFDEMKKQLRKLEDIPIEKLEIKKEENDALYNEIESYEHLEHDALYNNNNSYSFRGGRARDDRTVRETRGGYSNTGENYNVRGRGYYNTSESKMKIRCYHGHGRGGGRSCSACFVCSSTQYCTRECTRQQENQEQQRDIEEQSSYIVDIEI